jgi:hypothetical protein
MGHRNGDLAWPGERSDTEMIEATQRKLGEAQFFYQHLVNAHQQHRSEQFRYYFSAFLSAAISVPDALSYEGKKKYRTWKPKWVKQLTPEERKLEKFMYRLRVAEVQLFRNFVQLGRPTCLMEGQSGPVGIPSLKAPAFYLEHEGEQNQVTAICRQHLDYLEKMVAAFLKAHA